MHACLRRCQGRRICLSPGGGPVYGCGAKPGQGLPGEPGSVPGQESRLPSPLSCLCHFRGAWRQSPYLLYSHPAMSASWLALATGSSLASTQTQASARPSGRLSLATQGPPGPGSRSGQSPPSPSQMASLLIALWPPLAPDPCRPQLGQDLVWGMMEKPSFRPSQEPGPEQMRQEHVLAA